MTETSWLSVTAGDAPLLVSLPHTGTDLAGLEPRLVSPALARKDTDWWIERLYDFAGALGATVVRTTTSRTVVDVNRDPSGVSLYPGQATTSLCPTTTFDGEPLYRDGEAPSEEDVSRRVKQFFDPYHAALGREAERLRGSHPRIVVYDCHSIRSVIPRLFEGTLPHFNVGTNDGRSCDPALTAAVEEVLDRAPAFRRVTNGRFKGGFITRSLGRPAEGVHAVQMELACRGYMREPTEASEANWPTPYDAGVAAPMREVLEKVLAAALAFARN